MRNTKQLFRSPVFLFMLILFSNGCVYAQNREIRQLNNFKAISVGGGIDLYITQADEFEVVVEAEDPADIITEVEGGMLKIKREATSMFNWFEGTAVYVKLPELEAVKCSGGSDTYAESPIRSDFISIDASGGSDIKMTLEVNEVNVNCSGGSDVLLSGMAKMARVESSGGSDFTGFELETEIADLNSSGGSDIEITVTEKLTGRASGGSDILYRGNPKYVDTDTSGGADISGE